MNNENVIMIVQIFTLLQYCIFLIQKFHLYDNLTEVYKLLL